MILDSYIDGAGNDVVLGDWVEYHKMLLIPKGVHIDDADSVPYEVLNIYDTGASSGPRGLVKISMNDGTWVQWTETIKVDISDSKTWRKYIPI